jgi:signal transduction histidine kinase
MRRLRVTFVGLAILLVLPLSLLLWRAWQGIERERDARHELVASRVFDEAERTLGDFVRDEQNRPEDHYLRVNGNGIASPLAASALPDFVIGYFEIDRSGEITLPHDRNRSEVMAQLRDVLPRLRASLPEPPVRALMRQKAKKAALESKASQAPGTTRTLQKVDLLKGAEQLKDEAVGQLNAEQATDEEASQDSDLSSYRVLEKLNLASRKRAAPEPSVLSATRERAPEPLQAPATSVAPESVVAEAREDAPRELERDGFAAAPSASSKPEFPAPSAASGGAGARSEPRASRVIALRTPLAGLAAGDTRLVLHRTVLRGDEGAVEQGLLIDLVRLCTWLESQVLGDDDLRAYLDLDFPLARGARESLPSGRFVYEHRFQEPFAALSATLSVAPLPDEGSAEYLAVLGALLVLASTAGLWAVYRRVAAAVHFSERRSNFAAAVSHELKTPLTAIRMYAEMLRDGMVADDTARRSYLDTITSESERLTRLINNVLEFSRLERRTHDLALVCESPLPALRAALRTLEPHARAQGFDLRAEIADTLPAALHDRDALQQIFFNLIDNALKYARHAQRKEIVIMCAASDAGVTVRVRDFGPGVAREHEPHLFEPFYRGGDELTRQTQGTGIGLALVRELAQRMQADVSAHNCSDGGFAVELRLRGA